MKETKIFPVPSWLCAPPDGTEPNPPVESRAQSLPFEDLTWPNFERLIVRLARREGDIFDCFLYGTPGQAQEGLDILGTHQDQPSRRVCYQCKKVLKFDPADIKAAVDKFLSGKWAEKCCEFVLCVASSLESTQHQDQLDIQRVRLFDKGIKLVVWDGASAGELCERLKNCPDLVDDFFGRPWVRSFNGHEPADKLGERLNGYELESLRNRLFSLYSVLFAQHDPGLDIDGRKRQEYHERYVPADITERAEATVLSSDTRNIESSANEDSRMRNGEHPQVGRASTVKIMAYDTRRPVLDWLSEQHDCVVLGEPGFGKSAMLRYLALSILQFKTTDTSALDPAYSTLLPIWIPFSGFSAAIDRESNVSVEDFYRSWLHQYSFDDIYPVFARAARSGQVLLLVDGLDEFSAEESGREALNRIVTFVKSCNARIICTSRPRGYRAMGVPGSWTTATLTPLSDKKIELLATRWFLFLESGLGEGIQNDTDALDQAGNRAVAFLRAVRSDLKTLKLARNPLLCLALIQLFRFSHQLPEARVTAYKQVVELLLSRHPAARAQASGTKQPLDKLGLKTTDLNEILIRIAWTLQAHKHSIPLPRSQCEKICAEFLEDDMYGLGESTAQARRLAGEVIDQLITHYGVLVERAPGELNFMHLSIQEYLAAESIVRKPNEVQLNWMSDIWLSQNWRETLISWFGILGDRGEKTLSCNAAQKLAELGKVGEWQRIQSLALRSEIATSDLGLPVVEARRIVEECAREIEISIFSEFRSTLARNITVGALGSSVQNECRDAIKRWMPGQSVYKRVELLEAFREWEPSDTLRKILLLAIHDEDGRCRRTAAEAFASLYFESKETLEELRRYSLHHVNPEIRAAALHGLGSRPEWANSAAEAAAANIKSSNAELLLIVSRVRVQLNIHDDGDLDRLWSLWATDAVDYWLRDELVDSLCAGWPSHNGLRKAFVKQLESRSGTFGIDLPLEYLIRCYPGDDMIAEIIERLIIECGSHFAFDTTKFWDHMRVGFKGHKLVSAALRIMLQKHREEFKAIFWHPNTAPAFAVIGDDKARDDLLSSYENTTDLRDRYWIASVLFTGWANDELVLAHIRKWAEGSIAGAIPLVMWGEQIIPDSKKRHTWLLRLANDSVSKREIGAIRKLLEEFPGHETKQIAERLLENEDMWFYNRMSLEELFAKKFPDDPKSLEIFERSLSELDGPNPGNFAASFQHSPKLANRLVKAAVTVPVDVRMIVAATLSERMADFDIVDELTHEAFAEENSAVRSSCFIARARAARDYPAFSAKIADELVPELSASGMAMDNRKRSAISGLLELGCHHQIVSVFVKNRVSRWSDCIVDQLKGDPVAIGTVIENWDILQPLLQNNSLDAELPVAQIVYSGYDALLEQTLSGQKALDSYFETKTQDWVSTNYYEAFSRRHPTNTSLRSMLLDLVGSPHRAGGPCTAARLLAKNFSGCPDIWLELSARLGTPKRAVQYMASGVLGYMVLGWPDGELATWVKSTDPDLRSNWSPRDRLLIAIALKNAVAAEVVANEIMSETVKSWKYRSEDTHALGIWAENAESTQVVASWIASENPSLSSTAISFVANLHTNVVLDTDELVKRFNAQFIPSSVVPMDGLDATTGRQTSWAGSIYTAMNASFLNAG